jgi:hypothetical protein
MKSCLKSEKRSYYAGTKEKAFKGTGAKTTNPLEVRPPELE